MNNARPPGPGWYPHQGTTRYWDGVRWTHHQHPPVSTSRHLWWTLSPAWTCAMVSFVPALHGAIKLQRRDLWTWAVGLVIGNVVAWGLLGTGSSDPDTGNTALQNVGAAVALVMAVIGTLHAFRIRDAVFAPSAAHPPTVAATDDPAVARSLAARRRRQESVALSRSDPGLARDLMIGRPDLRRQYDDGGLVDVNHVPAGVMVSYLQLTPEQARAVIEAREHIGGFSSVDDLGNLADLPPRTLDAVRDRIVTL